MIRANTYKIINHWRQILFLYLLQLLTSLSFFYMTIESFSSLQNSKAFSSIHMLDRTVISDFVKANPSVLGLYQEVFLIVVLLYIIVHTFINAGVLKSLQNGEYSIRDLFRHGAMYFWKFLLINLSYGAIVLLITGLSFLVFFTIVGDPIIYFDTEKPLVHWVLSLLFLSMLVLVLFWGASLNVKIRILKGNKVVHAFRLMFRKIGKVVGLIAFYAMILIVIKQGLYHLGDLCSNLYVAFLCTQLVLGFSILLRFDFYNRLLK